MDFRYGRVIIKDKDISVIFRRKGFKRLLKKFYIFIDYFFNVFVFGGWG